MVFGTEEVGLDRTELVRLIKLLIFRSSLKSKQTIALSPFFQKSHICMIPADLTSTGWCHSIERTSSRGTSASTTRTGQRTIHSVTSVASECAHASEIHAVTATHCSVGWRREGRAGDC